MQLSVRQGTELIMLRTRQGRLLMKQPATLARAPARIALPDVRAFVSVQTIMPGHI